MRDLLTMEGINKSFSGVKVFAFLFAKGKYMP